LQDQTPPNYKRGSTGHLDFVSPLPCPFNYGSVPAYIGLEGDLLDAVVLGPRLPRGSRARVRAFGAVGLTDRGMHDDKLICSPQPLRPVQRQVVLLFFRFYARCKGLLNLMRRDNRGSTAAKAGAVLKRPSPGPAPVATSPGGARASTSDHA
jgi:inorganic pyrophosphatase